MVPPVEIPVIKPHKISSRTFTASKLSAVLVSAGCATAITGFAADLGCIAGGPSIARILLLGTAITGSATVLRAVSRGSLDRQNRRIARYRHHHRIRHRLRLYRWCLDRQNRRIVRYRRHHRIRHRPGLKRG